MCGKNFKKDDHIDCKIMALKVKKIALFPPYKIRVSKLWFSLVNFFFIAQSWDLWWYGRIMSWESTKKEKSQKILFSFLKRPLSRKRYVMKKNWIMSISMVRMF
jgi:hypothetical protein